MTRWWSESKTNIDWLKHKILDILLTDILFIQYIEFSFKFSLGSSEIKWRFRAGIFRTALNLSIQKEELNLTDKIKDSFQNIII